MIPVMQGLFFAGFELDRCPGDFRVWIDAGVHIEQGESWFGIGIDEFAGKTATDAHRDLGVAEVVDLQSSFDGDALVARAEE